MAPVRPGAFGGRRRPGCSDLISAIRPGCGRRHESADDGLSVESCAHVHWTARVHRTSFGTGRRAASWQEAMRLRRHFWEELAEEHLLYGSASHSDRGGACIAQRASVWRGREPKIFV